VWNSHERDYKGIAKTIVQGIYSQKMGKMYCMCIHREDESVRQLSIVQGMVRFNGRQIV
jgi:hypothetical protein